MSKFETYKKVVGVLFGENVLPTDEELVHRVESVAYQASVNEAMRNLVQNVADILRCPATASSYPTILSALYDVIDNSNKKSQRIAELEKAVAHIADSHVRSSDLNRKADAYDQILTAVAPVCEGETVLSKVEAMRDRCNVLDETNQQGLVGKMVFLPYDLRMETADLITTFAENLAQRLIDKQRQGRGGWESDDWRDECIQKIYTAEKPIDLAAYAVFAWHHDWAPTVLSTTEAHFVPGDTQGANNITINVSGDLNLSGLREFSGLLRVQDFADAPHGFRTEPCKHHNYPAVARDGKVYCTECGMRVPGEA